MRLRIVPLLVVLLALWPRAAVATGLAKFEPLRGCYVGAFIERDFTVQGDISVFEELTRKKHASYFTYVGYGQPFPTSWVNKIKEKGAAPHIAFEPNAGLEEVTDSPYLRAWARDAARAGCPIFLRWASEMNGPWTVYSRDPALYKEKYRLVSRIIRREAPNVAMVWTPFAEPQRLITQYYPGDDAVDWVGVNIYSVYVNNGDRLRPAYDQDPVEFLRFVYDLYAARKPLHISEYAATIYCKGTSSATVDFAIDKMTRFYTALRRDFPRVKAVNWFCLDTIRSGLANNNYSLLDDGRVLATYRRLVADNYFLSSVTGTEDIGPAGAGNGHESELVAIRPARLLGEDAMLNRGAVAATLDRPMLRGLKADSIVAGDLHLRVQLPVNLVPRYMLWQLDGQTVAITNTAPFRHTIERARILDSVGPGRHKARVVVYARDGRDTQHLTPEVEFEVPAGPPGQDQQGVQLLPY